VTRKIIRIIFVAYFATAMLLGVPQISYAPKPDKAQAVLLQPKQYAKVYSVNKYHWSKAEFACLDNIWTHESNWNPASKNSKSTAFGIAQLLFETDTNPAQQVRNGMRYIRYRYGTPCKAWQFWKRNYWY